MQTRSNGFVRRSQSVDSAEEVALAEKKFNYCDLIKYDASQPAYNSHLIDFELFKLFYNSLSPWGKATMAEDLAARLFRVCCS